MICTPSSKYPFTSYLFHNPTPHPRVGRCYATHVFKCPIFPFTHSQGPHYLHHTNPTSGASLTISPQPQRFFSHTHTHTLYEHSMPTQKSWMEWDANGIIIIRKKTGSNCCAAGHQLTNDKTKASLCHCHSGSLHHCPIGGPRCDDNSVALDRCITVPQMASL